MRQTNEMWEMESTAPAHSQVLQILLPSWMDSIFFIWGKSEAGYCIRSTFTLDDSFKWIFGGFVFQGNSEFICLFYCCFTKNYQNISRQTASPQCADQSHAHTQAHTHTFSFFSSDIENP